MSRIIQLSIGTLLLAVLAVSCMLQSPEESFHVVNKEGIDYPIVVKYSLDGIEFFPIPDTIRMRDAVYLQILSSGMLLGHSATINEVDAHANGGTPSDITIQRGSLGPGIYNLRVTVQLKSQTGSLADLNGLETIEEHLDYVLVITDTPPIIPVISTISIADGKVKITFPAYTQSDFQYYELVKDNNPATANKITDQSATSIYDSHFIAGNTSYKLIVNNGADNTSASYPFFYDYGTDAKLSLQQNGSGYKLLWRRFPLYANVKTTQIRIGAQDYYSLTTADTSINLTSPVLFGMIYNVEIEMHDNPAVPYPPDPYVITRGSFASGKKLTSYSDIMYDPHQHAYYLSRGGNAGQNAILAKLSDQDFTVIDSVINPFGQNEGGKILISENGQYHYLITSTKIIRYNPDNLNVITSDVIHDLVPAEYMVNMSRRGYFGITNNNQVMFRDASGYQDAYIIDMNSKVVRSLDTYVSGSNHGHISPDGNYVVSGNMVNQFSGGDYHDGFYLPYTNSKILYVQFLYSDPSHLVVVMTDKVAIYDCVNHTELFSFSGLEADNAYLDQSSGNLIYESLGVHKFNTTTHSITPVNATMNVSGFLLEGDALFCSPFPGTFGLVLKSY